MPAADSHGPASKVNYVLLSALWFGFSFFWATLLPLIIPRRVEAVVPAAVYGTRLALLFAAGAIFSALVQVTVGFFSDHTLSRLGRRKPYIVFGIPTALVVTYAFLAAPSFGVLLVLYCGIQLTLNTASIPYQALLPDNVAPDEHGKAATQMGLFSLFGQLAGLVAVASIALAAGKSAGGSLTGVFLAYLVVLLALGALTVVKVPDAPNSTNLFRWSFRASGERSVARAMFADFLDFDLRSHPNFVLLWFSRIAIFIGYFTLLPYVYKYVKTTLAAPRPEVWAGILLAVITLGGVAGNFIFGARADKTSKKLLIGLSLLISALFLVVIILSHSLALSIIAGALLGVGWGGFLAVDWAFACNLMPRVKTARYMGVWDIATLFPQVAGPIAAGLLRDRLYAWLGAANEGSLYRIVFATIFVWFIVGLAILRFVREERAAPTLQA